MDVFQGASQNWDMVQDKQGVLYIANNDGVVRFDGLKWDLMTIAHQNYVFSLAINASADLFVGSFHELGYFKKDSFSTYRYHSLTSLLPRKYQNPSGVSQTIVFKDGVFYNDKVNIYLFKNNRFTVFNTGNHFLFKLKEHLFLAADSQLLEYRNGGFERSPFNDALNGLHVKRIADYGNGSFLFLDGGGKLWLLNPSAAPGKKLRLFTADLGPYQKYAPARQFATIDNGMIALRTNYGIVFVDSTGRAVSFSSADMLGVNMSNGFYFEDRYHNLWVGVDGNILQIITSSPLSFYNKLNGLNGTILAFGKKGADVYAGTSKGLFYKENDGSFSAIPVSTGENWNFFNFNSKLYLAQASGVFELQGKHITRLIDHRYVQTIGEVRGRSDRLILGTFDTGIWLLQKNGNIWSKKKIKGFEEETRFIQQDDDGDLWISHYNKGIFRLRLNNQMDSVLSETFYDSKNGLPSNLNNRIYRLKNGRIIAATTDGIYVYNKQKNKFEPDLVLGKASKGICVYTLTESANGDIYFWGAPAVNQECAGAFIRQKTGSYQLALNTFSKTAIHTNGLRVDVDAPLFLVGQNELWIGNEDKVISYNPAQKTYLKQPVIAFIKQVWAGDSLVYANGARMLANSLPYFQNKLRFVFFSPFYENPEKTEYQFKLNGFENKWSDWTPQTETVFTNLNEGNYTFWVRAKNLYGNISEPVSFPFHINAPWYKTSWAYALYFILALIIIQLSTTLILNRIKRQKQMLEEKVDRKTAELRLKNDEVLEKNREILEQSKALQELNLTKDKLFSIISHDLRGPIGQIKQTLELIETGDLSVEELQLMIPELNESIESAFTLTDNLLYWAKSQMEGIEVNPVWFDLMEIADENYHLFKPHADSKGIRLQNNISSGVLVYGDKNMIKLVLRNLINNAIKFTAKGGQVVIRSEITPGHIEIFVQDTGTGLSAAEVQSIFSKENFHKSGTLGETGSGLGLMLCQDFIEKNGGKINVESQLGRGSKFSFMLNLK